MQMHHSGVDKFIISRLCTKAPDIKTTTVVDCSRSAIKKSWACIVSKASHVMILNISQDDKFSSVICRLWMFEISAMANFWDRILWTFESIWSFLTRPGDKHDKKISNCIALRLPSRSKLTILAIFQPFSRQDSQSHGLLWNWYHSEVKCFFVQLKRKYLLLLNHNWFSSCKRWELQAV